MKPGLISVALPVYHIESDVTYHTERKPTVFERMILRLCDPGLQLPDRRRLSLLNVFRDQLGAGDASELLESSVSELIALGALPRLAGREALDAPLATLELTADGLHFLRNDTLPVRSRTVKIHHRYDPIGDEIKPARKDGGPLNPRGLNLADAADQALRPKNPLPQVERAIAQEAYDWKNAATVVDRIAPSVQLAGSVERALEISCSNDGVLSATAPRDAALQRWMEQAQPELAWEVLLAGALTADSESMLPAIDAAALRDARAVRTGAASHRGTAKTQLCIAAQGVAASEAATPVIVLSPDVTAPELVADDSLPSRLALHVPRPDELMAGFRELFVPQTGGATVQVEVAGKVRLYWAGQPRLCDLAITLSDHAAHALWTRLRQDLERLCRNAEDPRIALLAVAWRGGSEIDEIVWPWLAARTARPLGAFLALAEDARQAVKLWRPDPAEWKSAWDALLARAANESLSHTPSQLAPEEIVPLLNQTANALPANLAAPLQLALLPHAAPVLESAQLATLRAALPPAVSIPEALLGLPLRQAWLEQALARAELILHGPHALQEPLQSIGKAVQDVYRDIGEQALKAAGIGRMDPRSLTPRALDAVRAWRTARDAFGVMNAPSARWDALDQAVESWTVLAQEKLAPVETGLRMVVLDTSALMEDAELLRQLRPNDIAVVPRRVLSELDGLKDSDDESRAGKARAAIRQVQADASRIRYETEYGALLPAEWDARQPDHAILSTALFFRLNQVLVVSNDINLRNKAQSLGLNSQDAKAYAPSRPISAAAPDKPFQKQGQQKNRRK